MKQPVALDFNPNPIEVARRKKASGSYIDLTSSNPTTHGILFPPEILRAASAPYWEDRTYTPDPKGYVPAREAIFDYYVERGLRSKQSRICTDRDGIFVTSSTSEAYSLLFSLLTKPGDNVLAASITYPLFETLADLHHIELRPYHLNEDTDWSIDWHDISAQIDDRTRIILIVSPHNPTGAVEHGMPSGQVITMEMPIIVDEVFCEFVDSETTIQQLGGLVNNPVFTLNGISKMFALPDLKLGWVAMNTSAYERFGEPFEFINDTYLGANSLTQRMLPDLFRAGGEFMRSMCDSVRARVHLAYELLRGCNHIDVRLPAGGYYLFPKLKNWYDDESLVLFLLEHGVFVHPGHFYNYTGDGARIMISCLTREPELRAGIERLIAALN